MGRRRRPFYRIAAFDSRTARDGRCLEVLGTYDPLVADEDKQVELKIDRVTHWLDNGALPSDTVASIIKRAKARKETPADVPVEAPAIAPAAEATAEEPASVPAAAAAAEAPASAPEAEAAAAESTSAPAAEAAAEE